MGNVNKRVKDVGGDDNSVHKQKKLKAAVLSTTNDDNDTSQEEKKSTCSGRENLDNNVVISIPNNITIETKLSTTTNKPEAKERKYSSDLIVVLDLDETLWWLPRSQEEELELERQHSFSNKIFVGGDPAGEVVVDLSNADDVILPIRFRPTDPDPFIFPCKLRPGLLEFLKKTALNKKYEVHVFTRGTRDGAAPHTLDALGKAVVDYSDDSTSSSNDNINDDDCDGERRRRAEELFAGRWFSDDCEDYLGLGMWYTKPLKKVVRASRHRLATSSGSDDGSAQKEKDLLKRIVIVDDRSDSYYPCNRNNGIPVRPFKGIRQEDDITDPKSEDCVDYGEDSTRMFEKLYELLETLDSKKDVRPVLKSMFHNDRSGRQHL